MKHRVPAFLASVAIAFVACSTAASAPPPAPSAQEARTTAPTATPMPVVPLRGCESPLPLDAVRRALAATDAPALPERAWGLHCTDEELAVWRARFVNGPYRSAGDAGEHTPGDVDRIRDNADRLIAEAPEPWPGPPQSDPDGCVPQLADDPPLDATSQIRDAAFVSLIEDDPDLAELVVDALLAQAREPGTAFTDTSRWCPGVLVDVNPSFFVANWATKLLFAYDYLGPNPFTANELDELDAWFAGAARYLLDDLDGPLDDFFADRAAGDYGLAPWLEGDAHCSRVHYVGGPPNCLVHRYYNNRKAMVARFVGLTGIHLGNDELVDGADRFFRELLMFGVFPDGVMGDLERWTPGLPDLGWGYATQTIAPAVVFADALARTGDDDLISWETSEGRDGSEGGPKSLLRTVRELGHYLDGTYERDVPEAREGDARIDGRHEPTEWFAMHDLTGLVGNRYWQDRAVDDVIMRRTTVVRGFPEKAARIGRFRPWNGEGDLFPGVLLMFGDMDPDLWPYPGSEPPSSAS